MPRRSIPGWPRRAPLVRVVGTVTTAEVETAVVPDRVDHVWLTVDAGLVSRVLISINTFSRRNLDAGFDPRVRLGEWSEPWEGLPAPGAWTQARFSYADHEARVPISYETLPREALETRLLALAESCLRVEVIGTPYHRRGPGLHQVHSRLPSCAVREGMAGLDGALRFFLPANHEARWLFFKFCGQP